MGVLVDTVIGLLQALTQSELQISWPEIIEFQTDCLRGGVNGIGLPDLIIAQNALQHGLEIFSLDKHFKFLQEVIGVPLYTQKV